MTEIEMKAALLARYTKLIDDRGPYAAEGLNTLQDVARMFGWQDTLQEMQQQAREKL
jgi:hypothetical protein